MPAFHDVLIVGAGHGGAQCAIALRQQGFGGSVALMGDEAEPPYERPPLSKEYFSGEKSFDRILIRPLAFWGERQISLLPGRRVLSVVPSSHQVRTADGERIGYGRLVWAAGGRPRRLSCAGHDLAGVHCVRNRADVDRMLAELASARRIVVIGGGYIGLEAAAALNTAERDVTVLEGMDRVLARVAGEPLSRFFEAEHRARGVVIRLGASVDCLVGDGDRVRGVRLQDGQVYDADMVVVGIGIEPEVGPLLAAGANCTDGVEVDAFCRTNLPDIYAVGDCARHASSFAGGEMIRVESVQNASDQAIVAAKHIVGTATPYDAVPWFWSNQYDLKLQTVGLSAGHDEAILRGSPSDRSFSLVYLRENKVIAIDCVNQTRDYVQAKAHVIAGAQLDKAQIADPSIPLKQLIAA